MKKFQEIQFHLQHNKKCFILIKRTNSPLFLECFYLYKINISCILIKEHMFGEKMEKEYRVSVKDLVSFSLNKGSIDKKGMPSLMKNAFEGTYLHAQFQKQMTKDYTEEVFQKEVYLSEEIDEKSIKLLVSGRIDGLLLEEVPTIYEVKTTNKKLEHIDEESFPEHFAQARLYAYMYAKQNKLNNIKIIIVYISRNNYEKRMFISEYQLDELEDIYYAYVYKYINWLVSQMKWENVRNMSAQSLEFPFTEYRNGQRQLAAKAYRCMRDEERLYAQAPTGIGKTMATLFPAVKALGEGVISKIFYLTAKTITRQVALNSYNILKERGLNLRAVTITAKDKMCPHEIRNCDKDKCDMANNYYERLPFALSDMLNEQCFDRQTINRYAYKYNICPYELSLDVATYCDLIICDYNYLFDPIVKFQRFFVDKKADYCFLIDEAHNLVDRGRETFSSEIIKSDILNLKKKTNKDHKDLKKIFTQILKEIQNIKKDLLSNLEDGYVATSQKPDSLIKIMNKCANVMEGYFEYEFDEEYKDEFLNVYFNFTYFKRIAEFYDQNYKTFYEIDGNDFKIKLMCLNPSDLLSKAMDVGKSAILFSATLEPKNYYMSVLGAREFDASISLTSPFPSENLKVLVEGRISTKYRNRDLSYDSIANLIKEGIGEKVGNYIVFFPSYKYMKKVIEEFELIDNSSEILIQNSKMDEIEREMFLERFEHHGNSTLVAFAVMGGLFGEGIDLEGDKLTGVIIVGTGLPMVCPKQEMIKEYFDTNFGSGFDYAYTYPGVNRVLQAAGRVIRTEKDKGFVMLIDSRFANAKYRRLYPKWWDVKYYTYQDMSIKQGIIDFFE